MFMLCALAVHSFALSPPSTVSWRRSASPQCSAATPQDVEPGAQLVWLTGAGDLRAHDNGGLSAAAEAGGSVVPVFVLDDKVHLRGLAPAAVRRLHAALSGLQAQLGERLVVRSGDSAAVLEQVARECAATACHVISDDVDFRYRASQQTACAALAGCGLAVRRYEGSSLRRTPWEAAPAQLPPSFIEYSAQASALDLLAPVPQVALDFALSSPGALLSQGVPSLRTLLVRRERSEP